MNELRRFDHQISKSDNTNTKHISAICVLLLHLALGYCIVRIEAVSSIKGGKIVTVS